MVNEHLEMLENGTCTFWKKKSLHKKSKDIKFFLLNPYHIAFLVRYIMVTPNCLMVIVWRLEFASLRGSYPCLFQCRLNVYIYIYNVMVKCSPLKKAFI